MEDGENFDPFLLVPDPILAYLSSFLWLNDAVNFRRTCKRHAELGKDLVESKIQEETKAHIFRWLKYPPCKDFPEEIWTLASIRYGPQATGPLAKWPLPDKPIDAEYVCMNEGLDQAFTAGDLEAAEFFWERGGDLCYTAYVHAIANPTNFRQFVEYPLDRGYRGSLDKIMNAAAEAADVLLVRRCIWSGARNFCIPGHFQKGFKRARKCSKCGCPGHYALACK